MSTGKRRIALLTLAVGDEFKEKAKLGIQGKKMYCQKHGYDYIDDAGNEEIIDHSRPLPWSKVSLILKCLDMNRYDYLFWIDGDTHIMNPRIKIEDLIDELSQGKDFMVTTDWKMVNTGVFFVKCTDWSKTFWQHVWGMEEHINGNNWEQNAVIDCINKNILNTQEHTRLCPLYLQKRFNSYWYNWSYGDFILHFAGVFRQRSMTLKMLLSRYCPFRTDDDTDETFNQRMHWLRYKAEEENKWTLEETKRREAAAKKISQENEEKEESENGTEVQEIAST